MPVVIRIPAVFRPQVGGARTIDVPAGTLRDVIDGLIEQYPSLSDQLLSGEGQLHKFVNVYLNDEDVRYLEGLDTKIADGDTLAINPAVAGGSLPVAP